MSSTDEEGDVQWLPPPGIHEPYKLLETLTLHQFNRRAARLGFDKRWACGSKRVPWREHPSYNNCTHFSTMAMTSKIKIMSSDHSGVRPCDNFVFHFEDLEGLSSVMDTENPVVIKYLLSSDQTHVLVIFHGSDMVSHVGVIFNVTNKDIFGYYVVSSQAQFPVRQLKQFMLGESRNTLSLVVERQYSDMTLFTRQQFEVWSFTRNSKHVHKFDALHVHNSIAAAMRLHGPLFAAVPGQGVDMYCVAFFKDSYRLKNLYGSYFIALIDMVRNRYLRVVGPDSAGIRDMEASLRASHFQHLESSPCGTYLAVTYERFPGFQLQVCLFDTLSLTLVHSIQLPLYMGRLEGLLSAACCANTRVTFSHCSSRMSIFFQPNRDAMQQPAYIYVKVYQLPIAVTLANICKFRLLRSLTRMEIAQLPLPESMKGFLLSTKPQPLEEDYIETNYGLRLA